MAYTDDEERVAALRAAETALLGQITSWAENAGSPKSLLQLAEAFAWVAHPGQAHGVAASAPD